MEEELFIDTRRLRLHAEDVLQSCRKAQLLCDKLWLARNLGGAAYSTSFQNLLSSAQTLGTYYRRLGSVLEDLCQEAGAASWHIADCLENSIFTIDAVLRRVLPIE